MTRSVQQYLYLLVLLGNSVGTCGLLFNVTDNGQGFVVSINNIQLLEHTKSSPLLFVGLGLTLFPEDSGNFFIEDYTSARIPLADYNITCDQTSCVLRLSAGETWVSLLLKSERSQPLVLSIQDSSHDFDRTWLRVKAATNEEIYGGGEQFSYFNLRHREENKENVFPIWVREQGVGRNKSTMTTFMADIQSRAGGDYHTTYFPQPSFISSRHFYVHYDGFNYAELDFSHEDFHEIYVLGEISRFYFNTGDNLQELVSDLTSFLGKLPELPDWIMRGAVLGVQGGTQVMLDRYNYAKSFGIPVASLWIQDWSGKVEMPFGKRVNWDWTWDPSWYPGLDSAVRNLTLDGVKVMVYINPYLREGGHLYTEAASKGYLVKNSTGGVYLQRSVTLVFASVDLTNPSAFSWYKNVIKTNMIDFGFGGWMADFGEYLPVDAKLFDGRTGLEAHNEWPVLWARLNRETVEESGKLGDVVFFMRAGFSGVSNFTTLMWNGDQNVDFSLADGVRSTMYGSLSMAMSGVGLSHFDIGGYTTVSQLGLVRSAELLLRSAEMAVFTPIFRTHEGNQPEANVQWYSNTTTAAFARLARQFALLKDYRKSVVAQVSRVGIPAMRPVCLEYEGTPATATQYLFGPDLLVTPVYTENVKDILVSLPLTKGYTWIHIWSGTAYQGGQTVNVAAPLGEPAVFYRSDSAYSSSFEKLRAESSEVNSIIG
ncbi:sulfoquinovosidase-like [Biomphalaria glabrata]|uniref:Sulfoquinovosidase-like n=1 Tax=Biomphalaria glabrata TaxID=6526 RepID=A0A9W3A7Q2_BIOGL|nr:sulfoquinovosidase-like [Biomphalaria glabrata]